MSKLYTEEQVRKAYSAGAIDCEYKCTKVTLEGFEPIVNMEHLKVLMDGFVKTLTPIQLPTDEELEKIAKEKHIGLSIDVQNYRRCFVQGAKWMRDKIQGGQDE